VCGGEGQQRQELVELVDPGQDIVLDPTGVCAPGFSVLPANQKLIFNIIT
jgi:hypothetical protein